MNGLRLLGVLLVLGLVAPAGWLATVQPATADGDGDGGEAGDGEGEADDAEVTEEDEEAAALARARGVGSQIARPGMTTVGNLGGSPRP